MSEVNSTLERKFALRNLAEPSAERKQRLAATAAELNMAGQIGLLVELANEALCKFTVMIYERDADHMFANLDNRTFKILVPCPWGDLGWQRWELRKGEAVILRSILLSRVTDRRHPALFDYNQVTRRWHVEAQKYDTAGRAMAYLQAMPITVTQWREAESTGRERDAERMAGHRAKTGHK